MQQPGNRTLDAIVCYSSRNNRSQRCLAHQTGQNVKLLRIALIGFSGLVASGQTNLGTITFTNLSGKVVEGAAVVKVTSTHVFYKYADGSGGGGARLADLPAALQERFDYDAVTVAAEEKRKAKEKAAELKRAEVAAEAESARTTDVGGTAEGIAANPVRIVAGQRMDFSQAVKWYLSDPGSQSPSYGVGSSLYQDWERRKNAYEIEAQKWRRYLVSGSIQEQRAEGVLISVPVTKTIQDGYMPFAPNSNYKQPRYITIQTTKEVLLRNPPEALQLPVFAVPVGVRSVGTVMLEAYDYGTPVGLANAGPKQPTSAFEPPIKTNIEQSLTSAAQPGLEIISLTSRVMESNESWRRWSYQLKVRNNTGRPIHEFPHLLFLDADGFIIADKTCEVKLSAGETRTVLGTALVDFPGASRVKTIKIE